MKKKFLGYTLAISALILGQGQLVKASDAKSILQENLKAGFNEFNLEVDSNGLLTFKGIQKPKGGEIISEKSFLLSKIDATSVSVKTKGMMTFSCKRGIPCITYMRKENFPGRKGYDRKIKLPSDKFSIAPSGDSAAKTKQAFQQLIQQYSKGKK